MQDKIKEITRYMRENKNKEISIEMLAETFGYSKYYFSRQFKRYMGVSPNEYWASIRIEQMFIELEKNNSVLHAHLSLGYLSSGTFSNAFFESTGMTPSLYKKSLNKFYRAMHLHEETDQRTYFHYSFDKDDYRTLQQHVLRIHVKTPESFKGTIFIGIFKKAISNHAPMVGKAMLSNKVTIIDRIPNGKYYVMAVAIPKGSAPLSYFHLDQAIRDINREPVTFPLKEDMEMLLTLREKRDDDPPITVNPVKLLLNAIKEGNVE